MIQRWIAHQFAAPSGLLGRMLVGPWLDRIGAPLGQLAIELLDPQRGEALLDVGFGGGALLARLLAARPGRLAGVDVSEAMVHRVRQRFGTRVDVALGTAQALPFADGRFDGVTSVSVLHFWADLAPPLADIARVLRPGGRLVLVFEEPEQLRRWAGHRYGFQTWSSEAVIAAAQRVGLRLTERRDGTGTKPATFTGLRFEKEAKVGSR